MDRQDSYGTAAAESDATFTRLLRLPKVIEHTGLSRSMIYLLESQGKFPKRVKVGQRAVAWPEDEVQLWVEARKASRHLPSEETEKQMRSQALARWGVRPSETADRTPSSNKRSNMRNAEALSSRNLLGR